MKKWLFLIVLILPHSMKAQVIHVETEGWGTISKTTSEINHNGAMVWNGTEWVVNSTWAHKYFVDTRTGNRLKTTEIIAIGQDGEEVIDTFNYHIIRQQYSYTHPAKNGGSYRYTGNEYIVRDKTTGKQVVLRSRGIGNTTLFSYFDIYIQNEDTSGVPQTFAAIRNDPKWFTYSGMTMEQVLAITDTSQNLTGEFTPTVHDTLPTSGWFFCDFANGADLGPASVGKSYVFHTDLLPEANIANLNSTYTLDFALRWMDSSGNLHELQFLPKLISETYSPPPVPVVTTDSISNIAHKYATFWGKVTSDSGYPVTERGAVYSTGSNPEIVTGISVKSGSGTGSFTATTHELSPNTTYYVRAYAINAKGTGYGEVRSFKTALSTTLVVNSEGTGEIRKNSLETNLNGSMVWNGTQWVVNSTWAHQYFVNTVTKERVAFIDVVRISDIQNSDDFDTLNYHITRQNYSYSVKARDSGTYSYEGKEYIIRDRTTGKRVVLLSRGNGNGVNNSYFNIYIENDDSHGVPNTISVFLNDPKWYNYSGTTLEQVLAVTDTVQNLTGNLPTLGGQYFLDITNGADMGGKSYTFRTGSLPQASKTVGIDSSFPVDFGLRFMDSKGFVHQLDFLPELFSESYTPPLPTVTTDSIGTIECCNATAYGNVASGGGSPVTSRGFVRATITNPTLETGLNVPAGSGTGNFSAIVYGLSPGITYHIRAYAINSLDTIYGIDRSFLTQPVVVPPYIAIKKEGQGTIMKQTGEANSHGAIQWKCSEWVVDTTYAHRYFEYRPTCKRLVDINPVLIDNSPDSTLIDLFNYHIKRRLYIYSYPGKTGGSYSFAATEFVVTDTLTGRKVVLRSRGTGISLSNAYFDIYIENETAPGLPGSITALRNDPLWFTYTGITMEQALAQTSPTQNLTGNFSTTNGWYFMDINNGADLGGKSFIFRTSTMSAAESNTQNLGSSFPSDFAIRWMDATGKLQEIKFLPSVFISTITPTVPLLKVSTNAVTGITGTSATVWCNVIKTGGSAVSGQGVVYSLVNNPDTLVGLKIKADTISNYFSLKISGLMHDTTYYVRAYAINQTGISYGNTISFFTKPTEYVIKTEGSGTISQIVGTTNQHGNMVWLCGKWMPDTASYHRFWGVVSTGFRANPVTTTEIPNSSTTTTMDQLGYNITRRSYTYTAIAKDGGRYDYTAMEYIIENKITNKKIGLRSRGNGNGTGKVYFDIYLEDDVNSKDKVSVTGLRNGPKWYTFPDLTLDQALVITDTTQNLTGSLSSKVGTYYFDIDNGADLGGKSIIFQTDTLGGTPSKIGGVSPSYPVTFVLRFMDDSTNIKELKFLPKIVSETYTAPSFLTVFPANINVNATANSTTTFEIFSNLNWTVTSNQSWLTVNPPSGLGNDTITVTAGSNPLTTQRSAIVTVSATGVSPQTVIVTQLTGSSSLSVSPATLSVDAANGSLAKFKVTSNTSWSTASNQSWLSALPASDAGTDSVTVTATSNPLTTTRTAMVTVSATGATPQIVTVTQLAGSAMLSVSPATLSVASTNGSLAKFKVTSNTSWSTASNQSWLSALPASGAGTDSVTVTATSNPLTSTRTATVTVTATGITPQTITITQLAGAATLSVSPAILGVTATNGSSAKFKVTSNTNWSTSSNQSWLSVLPASGASTDSVTVTATSNPLTTIRMATVTVSAIGVTPQTVMVTQDLKTGTLIIPIEELSVYPNPFTDGFYINSGDKPSVISVYNLNGQLVFNTKIYRNEFIPAHQLVNGMYLIVLTNDQVTLRKKLIKR
jgi:hypothetical protein